MLHKARKQVGVAGIVFGRPVLESLAGDEFVISWAWQLSLEWGEHEEELAACCCRLLEDVVDGCEVLADVIAPVTVDSNVPRLGMSFGTVTALESVYRTRYWLAGVLSMAAVR